MIESLGGFMTIGIGAYGPRAGEAVFMALRKAELIGEGSIRGCAVFAAIKDDGELVYYKTQRGGTQTLVIKGEITGVLPPPDVLSAKVAALMSSGPDRPEPLELGLPGKAGVGIVSGHRIPILACRVHGKPMNHLALELMESGLSAVEAVESVIKDNQEQDAGLIAVDMKGNLGVMNSQRVERRTDVAKIYKEDKTTGAKVAVLLNEIHPPKAVAEVAAGVAMEIMTESQKPDFEVLVKTGMKAEFSPNDEVYVDKNFTAIKLITSDKDNLVGTQICCIPYGGAKVIQNNKEIGYTITEPLTIVENGTIVDLSGQKEFYVGAKYV
ncbi:MAG: hypothetical protein ACETWM_01975 [Candidatus Lokiarchaeia archaeon]